MCCCCLYLPGDNPGVMLRLSDCLYGSAGVKGEVRRERLEQGYASTFCLICLISLELKVFRGGRNEVEVFITNTQFTFFLKLNHLS